MEAVRLIVVRQSGEEVVSEVPAWGRGVGFGKVVEEVGSAVADRDALGFGQRCEQFGSERVEVLGGTVLRAVP